MSLNEANWQIKHGRKPHAPIRSWQGWFFVAVAFCRSFEGMMILRIDWSPFLCCGWQAFVFLCKGFAMLDFANEGRSRSLEESVSLRLLGGEFVIEGLVIYGDALRWLECLDLGFSLWRDKCSQGIGSAICLKSSPEVRQAMYVPCFSFSYWRIEGRNSLGTSRHMHCTCRHWCFESTGLTIYCLQNRQILEFTIQIFIIADNSISKWNS